MRLCNSLIQYFLFILLSLFVNNSHGHEHHNHVDPVTTKYSQSAVTVDPLNKPIETANVQKTDFQQHTDDDPLHDAIELRLRAKHDLRQSVHQHSLDDKQDDEQDYINQLNSALENDYKTEHQFQYAAPPIADSVNITSSQNQTKENVQVPLYTQNETTSLPTSLQPPTIQQEKTNEGLSASITDTLKNIQNLEETLNTIAKSDDIILPLQVQTDEQKLIDPIQQNIIKEDILYIHKETISAAQSHQQEDTLNIVKPITDDKQVVSNQQQPISNANINDTLPNNSSVDVKPSSPAPVQLNQPQQIIPDPTQHINSLDPKVVQQQKVPETIKSGHSVDLKSEQQKSPDPIQTVNSLDPKLVQQQKVPETIKNGQSVDLKSEQQKSPDPIQNVNSLDPKLVQQQKVPETIKSGQSVDLKSEQKPLPDPIQTVKSVDPKVVQQQKVPETIKSGQPVDLKSEQKPSPDPIQTVKSVDPKVVQQQKVPETIKSGQSVDLKSEQQKSPDTIQNVQGQKLPEPLKSDQSLDLKSEQQQASVDQTSSSPPIKSDSIQNINSSDQQKQSLETAQNISSIDQNTPSEQTDQQSQVFNTIIPTETVPIDTKSNDPSSVSKESPTLVHTSPPPARILRSATSRLHQKAQERLHHTHSHQEPIKTQQEPENISTTENTATIEIISPSTVMPTIEQSIEEHNHSIEATLPLTIMPTIEQPIEEHNHSIETPPPSLKPEEPLVETAQKPTTDLDINNETEIENPDQNLKPIDDIDLPRQVHVHDPKTVLNELKEELTKNENQALEEEIANNATVDSFLVNDHSPHLPRILESEEITSTTETITNPPQIIENNDEVNHNLTQNESKIEETNNSSKTIPIGNLRDNNLPIQFRQICWRLPKPFESTFELIENQLLRFINLLPEFLQTILFGRTDDRETLMNTIWFGSICTMCFLFSFIFLSLGAKRLKQSKHEKEIRARCQQLQQYNNQIELERATFERQNQKLSDEIDELKNLPVRDTNEELFELREKCERFHADWKNARIEHDALQRDLDHKNSLIQKHEFDMQNQVETVAYLNNEILRQKQELEKERETISQLQSNDLSLERLEKLQETIHELKSEITQLKQEKFAQIDQLQQVQEHSNQLDIDNNELTIKMKQLKDLLEQRDQTIALIREKMLNDDDDDEEKATEIGDILSTITENGSDNNQEQQELLSTIDNDVQKANQHMRNLHSEIDEKTRRIKDLDSLLNQEKDRCRELETKLKVILELRERDAHIHIRQLGQTDAELRKARTDTERVKILQNQLELKQQQLVDVQKVLASEQTKFSEECSKLQHETHEKWMEVKRLTRELDGAKKECEGLRRQITKYGSSDRSSQEKTMHKPVAHHLNNTGRLSSEPETNGNSPPPPHQYQQGENFRPIDHERSDSGAASPSEMFRMRPPMFGLARPPFFPPPFMPPPPPNPFLMGARFPMSMPGPHGMISPIPHLMTNGSGGGSDANSFEIVDSTNITPNSTSYDVHLNGSAVSPTPDDEQHATTTTKPKKPKKSLKKKTKTSTTTVVPTAKEDV